MDQSYTVSTGIFSRWTNQTQEAQGYSHDGPIRRRKRGYILTMDPSDAGSAGIFSRWTHQTRCGSHLARRGRPRPQAGLQLLKRPRGGHGLLQRRPREPIRGLDRKVPGAPRAPLPRKHRVAVPGERGVEHDVHGQHPHALRGGEGGLPLCDAFV
eukprot:9500455-Pyramimonas_sp.AAC.1